jgi:hypothetical protein
MVGFSASRYVPLCFAAALLVAGGDTALAQNQIIEETNKQLGRQISDSIARRTGTRITSEAIGAALAPAPTASDKTSSVWFNGTYNNISTDLNVGIGGDNVAVDAEIDIYQATVGLDHRFGNWFAGISGSYARGEARASASSPTIANIDANEFSTVAGTSGVSTNVTGTTISASVASNNYSVNPYVGYMITPYIYPLAILGYTRSEVVGTDIGADTLASDLSINYADRIGNWIARGKVGWRYLNISVDVPNTESDAVSQHTFYAGATVGYKTGIFLPYFSGQYERLLSNTDAPSGVTGLDIDPSFLYLTGGVDIDVIPNLSVGAAGQVEVLNSLTDSYSAIVNLRFRF